MSTYANDRNDHCHYDYAGIAATRATASVVVIVIISTIIVISSVGRGAHIGTLNLHISHIIVSKQVIKLILLLISLSRSLLVSRAHIHIHHS